LADSDKRLYEAMYLVDPALATSDWDAVTKAINTIMDRAGAEAINLRKWDECRLSYEVEGCKRGTYILSYFMAEPSSIGQIERDVQLNESLLRVLILRAEHMTEEMIEAPTPVMQAEKASQTSTAVSGESASVTDGAKTVEATAVVDQDSAVEPPDKTVASEPLGSAETEAESETIG